MPLGHLFRKIAPFIPFIGKLYNNLLWTHSLIWYFPTIYWTIFHVKQSKHFYDIFTNDAKVVGKEVSGTIKRIDLTNGTRFCPFVRTCWVSLLYSIFIASPISAFIWIRKYKYIGLNLTEGEGQTEKLLSQNLRFSCTFRIGLLVSLLRLTSGTVRSSNS